MTSTCAAWSRFNQSLISARFVSTITWSFHTAANLVRVLLLFCRLLILTFAVADVGKLFVWKPHASTTEALFLAKLHVHLGKSLYNENDLHVSALSIFNILNVWTIRNQMHCIKFQVIHTVLDNLDIHFTLTKSLAGGLISSRWELTQSTLKWIQLHTSTLQLTRFCREYVNTRHWKTKDGILMSAGCSVSHPDKPIHKGCVR